MGGLFPAEVPEAELVPPPAPPPLPRPGAWIGVSESGQEEAELVGVLPTLLPKRIYVTKGTNQKVPVCRAQADGP
jgi:hypothetical protein